MIKIYDNISNEILKTITFKQAYRIAKNRAKEHGNAVIILGKKEITIARLEH